jgi:VanZ family protein
MQSGDVKKTIDSLLAFFGIPVTMSEFLIRKAAHFTEYTVLGVLLILTLRSFTDRLMQHIFQPLFVGLAVPVTDEFIQLHVDGRAGLITDVILDFSGVFTGLMLTVLLILIRKRGKKREGGLPKRIRNGTL